MKTPAKGILNWPVVTGCERLSPGCNSCPSFWEYFDQRRDYKPVIHESALQMPLENLEPSHYEVAFGSDLFHRDIPAPFQKKVFEIMNEAHWHTFSVGTKRVARLLIDSPMFDWTDNIRITIPVESGEFEWRIGIAKKIPAKTKVISMVPIIGPFSENLDFRGIDAVGIAPETWGYQRACDPEWVKNVFDQCTQQGVPCGDETIIYKTESEKEYAVNSA